MDEVKAQIRRIKDNVDGIIFSTGKKGLNATKTLRDVTDNVGLTAEESFRAHPLATLVVAIGVGFIFGAIWRR